MKVGDVDILRSIIQLEHDVIVLNKAMSYITKNNRGIDLPDKATIDSFKDEAIKRLQRKYPNMGISRKR